MSCRLGVRIQKVIAVTSIIWMLPFSSAMPSIVFAANPDQVVTIAIDTINGEVPSEACFVGEVVLEGSGELTKAPALLNSIA